MIAQQLLATGILQLGYFQTEDVISPYRLNLNMLAAYPQLMGDIANLIVTQLPQLETFNRIVATADTAVIAGVVSYISQFPLVYSRGRGEVAVHDLIGAYDVGHPTCLIINTLENEHADFIQSCQRVGLNIHTIVPIIYTQSHPSFDIPIKPILHLGDIIRELDHVIPQHQAQAVLDTINT